MIIKNLYELALFTIVKIWKQPKCPSTNERVKMWCVCVCVCVYIYMGIRFGDPISNSRWIIEKAREFQKNIYFCFIDYAKAFDCVDHNKQWKILQEMRIPDHLTYLLRNLYSGQEATVRTRHGTTDWFQIGKGVHQGCILSPCLFNFYAEYII